jgi:acetylornithine/N-succinyldiaminopimelate aminotransferase
MTAHRGFFAPHHEHVRPVPIALSHGQGVRVWDVNGKQYLDGLGGIAVNTLGHNHPKLVPALQDQISKIIHSSNYYHVPNQEKLAAKLVELSGLTNVFFCSTGLEANEAALKLARKFGHDKGIERPRDRGVRKGLSRPQHRHAVGHRQREGAGRLWPAGRRLHPRAAERHRGAEKGTEGNPNVVAVFFEAIQGEGGVNPMRMDYLRRCARCATSATGC